MIAAAGELTGGWICLHACNPEFLDTFPISPETRHGIHYHAYCRFCHRVQENELCSRHHFLLQPEAVRKEGGCVLSECWAGVTELVVPIFREGILEATVAMGGYRGSSGIPELLTRSAEDEEEVRSAYHLLPVPEAGRVLAAGTLLTTALEGLCAETAMSDRGLSPYVTRARMLMQEHLRQPGLHADDIAGTIGISREHLSRLYRQETGETMQEYLHRQKMQRACLLLENTSMSIGGLSADLGYEDTGYFIRVFRKTVGLTPEAYRRTKRGNITEL